MIRSLSLEKWGNGEATEEIRLWDLGWFLRSRTGRIQTGAVRGTGPRVKQACTFPVCITSLSSEGLCKAPLLAQAAAILSPFVRENKRGTGTSAPTAGAETRALGAQSGDGPGLGLWGRGPALSGGGRAAPALHWG